ncbi:Metallo-beta-lactamase superfamily protein [Roseovarius litorisediminis]|uniref:Metallo-beta-lactamase superfamily protein n=1 Tax=Roseovarius litorisediminis TaxID=1312363 RepID=A0A1Y5S2Z9_9RHOB|nr:MBL fold metallo-hydrolase [Roseovarius litorisediminis]SLN28876.1 Metallo-beta-lactamase superfamily protein [Roseovarius litorisediminis]
MTLVNEQTYYIAKPDVYLRAGPGSGAKENHLLLGDWLRYLGDTHGDWVKVRCRGDTGWLKEDQVTPTRALEVNFVDIGQGDGCHIVTPDDDIILIDAGEDDNMYRFLCWRYNLRSRNVARAPDFDPAKPAREPWKIDHVVISHPDADHYYGLRHIFDDPKLSFGAVYHNGVVERPSETEDPNLEYPDDLGGYASAGGQKYLWDVVQDTARMQALNDAHPTTRKYYLSTIRACLENSPAATIMALGTRLDDLSTPRFMPSFGPGNGLSLQILGPLREDVSHAGQTREGLRKLGNEGVTKNGHSVILRLVHGKLTMMLGGDLNTQAQDFLLQSYTDVPALASDLENLIDRIEAKGNTASPAELQALQNAKTDIADIITQARGVFRCDVAKACHHGSHHFSDTFLQCLDATATVISSGDAESYAHPRPDALGAFGKYGRGRRPLIFSTELARSTREFTPVIKFLTTIEKYLADIAAASSEAEKKRLTSAIEARKDRNVAVYGMITLRALGDQVILAQKLEEPAGSGAKWDIHQLVYNDKLGEFRS